MLVGVNMMRFFIFYIDDDKFTGINFSVFGNLLTIVILNHWLRNLCSGWGSFASNYEIEPFDVRYKWEDEWLNIIARML